MATTGECLCGSVKYSITSEPMMTRTCWCKLCQKIGAGSATVNAMFAKDTVTIDGELGDYQCEADSGNKMHRRFCIKCGTPMFTEGEARPNVIGVRVGTLNDPEIGAPQATIWTSEAPSWACFSESIPKGEKQAV
jgi:hypothetical protein